MPIRSIGLIVLFKSSTVLLIFCLYFFIYWERICRFLWLHNKLPQIRLKAAHICYLTVSTNQESGDDLVGSCAQGLGRMQSGCQLGLCSYLRLGGLFHAHVVVGIMHFLAAAELMIACLFKASRTESLWLISSLISRPYFKGPIWLGQTHSR